MDLVLRCCTPYAPVEVTVVDATSQLHHITYISALLISSYNFSISFMEMSDHISNFLMVGSASIPPTFQSGKSFISDPSRSDEVWTAIKLWFAVLVAYAPLDSLTSPLLQHPCWAPEHLIFSCGHEHFRTKKCTIFREWFQPSTST